MKGTPAHDGSGAPPEGGLIPDHCRLPFTGASPE